MIIWKCEEKKIPTKNIQTCLQTQILLRQCGFLCRQRQLNQTQSVYHRTLLHSDQFHENEEQMQNEKQYLTSVLANHTHSHLFEDQLPRHRNLCSMNCKIPATTARGPPQRSSSAAGLDRADPTRTVLAV